MADVGKTSGPAQDLWLNGLLVARGLNSCNDWTMLRRSQEL